MIRIGQGVDAHAFCEGSGIILGGVSIPFDRAISADSDGDVLLHAICDALLGAAALGDLGSCFPEVQPKCDSRELLRATRKRLPDGATIHNLDATVIAQEPRIAPFVGEMRQFVAQDLHLDISCVSIKSTTTDHLGFTGRGEGIAVVATGVVDID